MLVDRINRTNIRMVQRCGRFGLADEAPAVFLGRGEGLGQKLQGDVPVQLGVTGLVDQAHPAFPKLFRDIVMRDRLTYHLLLRILFMKAANRHFTTILLGSTLRIFLLFLRFLIITKTDTHCKSFERGMGECRAFRLRVFKKAV